jgi:hypothetical protein
MTDTQHPITPPVELITRLYSRWFDASEDFDAMLTQAFQAGADQELEACCQWIRRNCDLRADGTPLDYDLRAARRPKPPSLKEQALQAHERCAFAKPGDRDTVRRALESLTDV